MISTGEEEDTNLFAFLNKFTPEEPSEAKGLPTKRQVDQQIYEYLRQGHDDRPESGETDTGVGLKILRWGQEKQIVLSN